MVPHVTKPISLVLFGMVALLGLAVISGWVFHIPQLIQVMPIFVPMQFNTALGLLLLGVSGLLLVFRYVKLSQILGLLIGGMAGVTLLQYLFGFNVGLDEFFIKHSITVETSHPGRMAPNTALCFVLCALAMCSYNEKIKISNKGFYNFLITSTVLLLALIALVGYGLDNKAAYGWEALTSMAVHTAIGFVVFATANLLAIRNFFVNEESYKPVALVMFISWALLLVILEISFVFNMIGLSIILLTLCGAVIYHAYQKVSYLEEKTRLIVESAGEGIVSLSNAGEITSINPVAGQLLGWEEGELIGQSFYEKVQFLDVNKRPYAKQVTPIFRTLRDGAERRVDTEVFCKKSKQPFPVDYTVCAVKSSSGDTLGAVLTFNDISQRVALEKKLKARKAELEEANNELNNFTYTVSHDLRAPLRHITGFIEILNEDKEAKVDKATGRYLQIIDNAAKKMSALIDGLLTFSRSGRLQLKKKPLAMGDLVDECITELSYDANGRKVIWEISDLPTIFVDESMMKLVVTNLLSNALKYTRGEDETKIKFYEKDAQSKKNEHVFVIKDNGAGFDKRYTDKLFAVFQRLHDDDVFEGTGIGLANVKRIVERHNGRVWAESELGEGATFYFTIPKQSIKGAKS